MKRNLLFLLVFATAFGLCAQIPAPVNNGPIPYHQLLGQIKPADIHSSGSLGVLRDYTGFFEIAYTHNIYSNNGTNNGWTISDSSTFTYSDSLAFAIADTTLAYVSSSQSWVNKNEFSVTLNGSHQPATKTGQVYDTAWHNNYNYIYHYNASGQLDSVVYQTYNGAWNNITATSYTYDASNRVSVQSNYRTNGTSLQNDTQYVHIYNSLGADSQLLILAGNGTGWTNYLQYNYQYTPVTNLFIGIDINSWNGTGYNTYGRYIYSRNGNVGSYLLQLYTSGNGQYSNKSEVNYTYDYRNNLLNYSTDSFNGNTAVPLLLFRYNYDIDNNPVYEEDAHWDGSAYASTDQYYYYYRVLTIAGIDDKTSNQLSASIFPNPSTGATNIRLSAAENAQLLISVYDAAGRKLMNAKTSVTEGDNLLPLQLSQLSSGNYFINLVEPKSGKSSTLNLVKE